MNKSDVIIIRVTPEQKETWTKQAEKLGLSLSAYIRMLLEIAPSLRLTFESTKVDASGDWGLIPPQKFNLRKDFERWKT